MEGEHRQPMLAYAVLCVVAAGLTLGSMDLTSSSTPEPGRLVATSEPGGGSGAAPSALPDGGEPAGLPGETTDGGDAGAEVPTPVPSATDDGEGPEVAETDAPEASSGHGRPGSPSGTAAPPPATTAPPGPGPTPDCDAPPVSGPGNQSGTPQVCPTPGGSGDTDGNLVPLPGEEAVEAVKELQEALLGDWSSPLGSFRGHLDPNVPRSGDTGDLPEAQGRGKA